MRKGLKPKKSKAQSSSSSSSRVTQPQSVSDNLKYFNSNFNEYSEDITSSTVNRDLQILHQSFQNSNSNPKFYYKPKENMSSIELESNEKSLAEIGFKTTEIHDWDKIVQPQKDDLYDLLHDMITKFKKINVKIIIDLQILHQSFQNSNSNPKFYYKPKENMSSIELESNEKSLAEIGFKTTEIHDWDKIVQPQKDDLYDLLHDMITKFKKTNVKIIIGKTTFNCHMMVLQCYSNFFMSIDDDNMVILPEEKVTPEAFIMVYEWMLAKEPQVQRDGILELFNAAQFLQIKGLVDQTWVCLDDDKRFCEDAAFLLYLEARKHSLELIQQLMLTRICKFFLTLVATKEFLDLSFKEICTLLQSNSIGVYSESEVLMAGVRWLHYNFLERSKHLTEVLACVRFGLMAPWQLVELKRNSTCLEIQEIVGNSLVQNMIDDGLSYVTTKYYYGNREKDFLECLKRLHLTEPVERQWIRDKTWSAHDHCPNKHIVTYSTFLEYLEYVRGKGKDHWKDLEFNERGPYLEYHSDVRSDDNKYLDDFCNLKYIIKS